MYRIIWRLCFYDGAGELKDGAGELADGTDDLEDGASKLLDGSTELRDGLHEFSEKTVDKVEDIFDEDIEPLSGRIDAIKEYSGSYGSYAGNSEDTECSTVFVFKNNWYIRSLSFLAERQAHIESAFLFVL